MNLQGKLVALVVILTIGAGIGWTVNGWRKDREISQIEIDRLKAYTENLQKAADKTYQLQLQKDEAERDFQLRHKNLLADAAAARAESGSLRDSLSDLRKRLPSLTEQAVRQYADTASVVFGECQERYTALAEQADRIDNDRQKLTDAWPK
jgi:hypothetical protein